MMLVMVGGDPRQVNSLVRSCVGYLTLKGAPGGFVLVATRTRHIPDIRSALLLQLVPGLRANRTLLPVSPTGVAMPPRTAGFGNRDRFELNGKMGLHRAAGLNSSSGMPPVAA